MLTAAMNALALLRFGAFRVMRGSSDTASILVAILIGVAAVIWAIFQADGRSSAKSGRPAPGSPSVGAPE